LHTNGSRGVSGLASTVAIVRRRVTEGMREDWSVYCALADLGMEE